MNDVRYDLRAYGFCTKVPLVTKDTQWKHYFDEKFAKIDIDIDPQEIKETKYTEIMNSQPDTSPKQTLQTFTDKCQHLIKCHLTAKQIQRTSDCNINPALSQDL